MKNSNKSGKVNAQFVKIKKENASDFLKLIKTKFSDEKFLDKRKKVIQDGPYVLFPLVENRENLNRFIKSNMSNLNIEIVNARAEMDPNYKFRSVEEALAGEIPEDFIELIPKSYDIIGKIAIIEFDQFEELNFNKRLLYKQKAAKAIVKVNKGLETVYEKRSEVKGKYRLKDLQVVFGEDNPETIHKENNCFFKLDVKNTYFTPRLVFERKRLSMLKFAENEIIVDMFAGVGPISIQIAKNNDVQVHSFDINPIAYKFLTENLESNKIMGVIYAHNIDVATLIDPSSGVGIHLKNRIDRIIMNLPEQSLNFIDIACFLMKKNGGVLHLYQFCEKPNPIEKGIELLRSKLDELGWEIQEISNSKIVKPFSPKSDLIVVDVRIRNIS